jgi:uncharacterized protein
MNVEKQAAEQAEAPPVLCSNCEACCCRLEVMLMGEDDVPQRFAADDAWGGGVMRRLDDGWCAALDRNTMRCTIYERRPGLCREYEMGALACVEERSEYFVLHPDHRILPNLMP